MPKHPTTAASTLHHTLNHALHHALRVSRGALALVLGVSLLWLTPAYATDTNPHEDDLGQLLKKLEEKAKESENKDKAADKPNKESGVLDRIAEVAAHAVSLIGVRYKFGGNTPETGFDCSGYVRHVFAQAANLVLPRRSVEISRKGQEVLRTDVQPGDLVFFNTRRQAYSHVGIYLGDNQFIHAPSTGGEVRIENMAEPYWTKRWNGARRLIQ